MTEARGAGLLSPARSPTICADEVVDPVVGVDGLPGVAPEPVYDVVLHQARTDEVVVDVRDLELASGRRLQRGDEIENRRVIAVDPGHRERARRRLRLLDDALHAAVPVELGNPQVTQMARVVQP